MIDYDHFHEWEPGLRAALAQCIKPRILDALSQQAFEYSDEALDWLYVQGDRDSIINTTLAWLRSNSLLVSHGTRLTDDEVASVRRYGLLPLDASARRDRLLSVLDQSTDCEEAKSRIDAVLRRFGQYNHAGTREGQVHLTLSKASLVSQFNHYLTHGSEFDQNVIRDLCGDRGRDLLRRFAEPRVVRVKLSGQMALKGAHPIYSLSSMIGSGETPNLVREFLQVWAYLHSKLDSVPTHFLADSGIYFSEPIKTQYIHDIETLSDNELSPGP